MGNTLIIVACIVIIALDIFAMKTLVGKKEEKKPSERKRKKPRATKEINRGNMGRLRESIRAYSKKRKKQVKRDSIWKM